MAIEAELSSGVGESMPLEGCLHALQLGRAADGQVVAVALDANKACVAEGHRVVPTPAGHWGRGFDLSSGLEKRAFTLQACCAEGEISLLRILPACRQ